MRAERASRLDRIARAALKQPRPRGIQGGGLALYQQLQALLRLAYRYKGLADVIFARFQPVPELIDHVLEHDLPVEMALHVIDDALQQRVAQVLVCGRVRPRRGKNDILAALQGAVRIRLEQQVFVNGGGKVALQCALEFFRRGAQHHPRSGGLRGMHEPAQPVDGREIETGNGAEIQQDAGRPRSVVQRLPEAVQQGADTAEEDVSAQPVRLYPFSLRPQDGAIGNGTAPVAVSLTGRVAGFDQVHAAEADGKEHHGNQHSDAHPLEKTQEHGDGGDQQENCVFGPGQPPAAFHDPLVQQTEAEEEQQSCDERHGDQVQDRVAQEDDGTHYQGGNDSGQPGFRPETVAENRKGEYQASAWAGAQAGDHTGPACRLELPVPLQLLVRGKFKGAQVHGHGDQSHHNQGQNVGNLRRCRRPIHMRHIVGMEGMPQTAFRRAGEQQARRPGLISGEAQNGQDQMVEDGDEQETHRQNEMIAPTFCGEDEAEAVGHARSPSPQRVGLQERGEGLPVGRGSHQRQGGHAQQNARPGDEAARHGIGDEPDQVGEPEMPDYQKTDSRGRRPDDHHHGRSHETRDRIALHADR